MWKPLERKKKTRMKTKRKKAMMMRELKELVNRSHKLRLRLQKALTRFKKASSELAHN